MCRRPLHFLAVVAAVFATVYATPPHSPVLVSSEVFVRTPAQLIDLRPWKLTLPTGTPGRPDEISQAQLSEFSDPDWFHPTFDSGVAFRAPVTGVTTHGSHYPRTELREMNPDGTNAAWSGTSGTHTLVVDEAFTALPSSKAQVVGAQVHDSANDIATFRLEGSRLYVTDRNNSHAVLITDRYVLGTRFRAQFTVTQGRLYAFYNAHLVATLDATGLNGAYFRAGAYTQANCTNSTPCSSANYGEVVIYGVRVQHVA